MIKLLYFGQIQSITSLSKEEFEPIANLNELRTLLIAKYPKLQNANFVFSVNQKITEQSALNDNDEVALLPPFSGG